MNVIRTQLLGEAIQSGRAAAKRKGNRPSTPEDTDDSSDHEQSPPNVSRRKSKAAIVPNISNEKTLPNGQGSSKAPIKDEDQDDELNNEDPDETEARLEAYAEEFERSDEPPIKWWFAAKGIPLIAATVGPLANLTSVAALVSPWRSDLQLDGDTAFDPRYDIPFADPVWAIAINAASLVFGVVGNFFLMCNYSRRVRYAIAMPLTIICWYLAAGLLSGILAAMHIYARPVSPVQIYSQAYWFGIISAALYLFSATILFINIFGFLKSHYPAHIESSKAEKNLMLQTVFFFAWLGIGALVFSKVEGWSYSDAVYFCNVTLLTVGFGDIAAKSDIARGLVFPFSVVGIIMLGLVVNSIHGFVIEIGEKQVVEQHITARRRDVADRAVGTSSELNRDCPTLAEFSNGAAEITNVSGSETSSQMPLKHSNSIHNIPKQVINAITGKRRGRPILLRASRDRFEAMRRIQRHTLKFKRWTALVTSSVAFVTLWLVGGVIFMVAEKETQNLTYFQSLYFCYVSLLTIGYGDLSPRSNAGKAFFLLWSIWSVPTITILISSMGSTVIENFQNATLRLAEYTILPKEGMREGLREIWVSWKVKYKAQKERRRQASYISNSSDTSRQSIDAGSVLGRNVYRRPTGLHSIEEHPNIPDVEIESAGPDEHEDERPKPLPQDYTFKELLVALTTAIRSVGRDVAIDSRKEYSYEEWVEFTRLIRACEVVKPMKLKGVKPGEEIPSEHIDDDEGFVLWDWIGEQSPLLYEGREPAWVQDRLTKGLEDLVKEHLKSISLTLPK